MNSCDVSSRLAGWHCRREASSSHGRRRKETKSFSRTGSFFCMICWSTDNNHGWIGVANKPGTKGDCDARCMSILSLCHFQPSRVLSSTKLSRTNNSEIFPNTHGDQSRGRRAALRAPRITELQEQTPEGENRKATDETGLCGRQPLLCWRIQFGVQSEMLHLHGFYVTDNYMETLFGRHKKSRVAYVRLSRKSRGRYFCSWSAWVNCWSSSCETCGTITPLIPPPLGSWIFPSAPVWDPESLLLLLLFDWSFTSQLTSMQVSGFLGRDGAERTRESVSWEIENGIGVVSILFTRIRL